MAYSLEAVCHGHDRYVRIFFLPLSLPPHTLTNMLFVAFQGPQRLLS